MIRSYAILDILIQFLIGDAHLPTRAVDCLEAGADLLHGLIACESAQGGHERLAAHELPQLLCSHTGQGMLDDQRALKALDIILHTDRS